MKQVTYYLHTLDGRPAYYFPGKQIFFMPHYGRSSPLCPSLAQLRKEQMASELYRAREGYGGSKYSMGYRRVRLP